MGASRRATDRVAAVGDEGALPSGPIALSDGEDLVIQADARAVVPRLATGSFQLVYLDPPFNTGRPRVRRTLRTVRTETGEGADRRGFAGRSYATTEIGRSSYPDDFADYLGFLSPLLEEAQRLLAGDGTLYLHLDQREAHYVKVRCDEIFGRDNFLNEVIWAYDYGGRASDRWAAKHDTILVYGKDVGAHFFDRDQVGRIPYMAPGLVTPEKRARGKLPTDVWWHTVVPTVGREKTGYPTQKPEGVLRRVVEASSARGARVLDFFAGSGTTGAVARDLGRRFVLVDVNPEAISVMRRRLGEEGVRYACEGGVGANDPSGDR
jgi:site-specific DNA-methyltransferase (adenine-specific)